LRRCADTRALLSPSRSPHTIQIYRARRGWRSQPPALYTRPWGRSDPFALGERALCAAIRCAVHVRTWQVGGSLARCTCLIFYRAGKGEQVGRTVTPLLQWSCEIQEFTTLTIIQQRISRMKHYSRTSGEHTWNVSVSPNEKWTFFIRKQSWSKVNFLILFSWTAFFLWSK
jgi:hypothetical protein